MAEAIHSQVDSAFVRFFMRAVKVFIRKPFRLFFLTRLYLSQSRAARRRARNRASGITVPPMLILSATRGCNLRCKGCYDQAANRTHEPELDDIALGRLLGEAGELGIGSVLLAGGEPLLRKDFIHSLVRYPEILFPIFTNGLLINSDWCRFFRQTKHVIPVVSVEGDAGATDARRGSGVHARLMNVLDMLRKSGLFYGLSITLTRQNFDSVMQLECITDWVAHGAGVLFFIEYVPVDNNAEALPLTENQRKQAIMLAESFRREFTALFILFPGDEAEFGGCLAAGRGFVHISASGRMEPCPFSPFSDTDIRKVPLVQAFQSRLLRTLREYPLELSEGQEGGCALFARRAWVESLVEKTK